MTSPSPSSPVSSSIDSSPVRPRGRIAFLGRRRGSSDDSIDSDDSDYSTRLAEIEAEHAQQEWEEGIEQLYTIASIILLPLLGKYFGRKFAHWSYARYTRVGLGARFFFGERIAAWFPVTVELSITQGGIF